MTKSIADHPISLDGRHAGSVVSNCLGRAPGWQAAQRSPVRFRHCPATVKPSARDKSGRLGCPADDTSPRTKGGSRGTAIGRRKSSRRPPATRRMQPDDRQHGKPPAHGAGRPDPRGVGPLQRDGTGDPRAQCARLGDIRLRGPAAPLPLRGPGPGDRGRVHRLDAGRPARVRRRSHLRDRQHHPQAHVRREAAAGHRVLLRARALHDHRGRRGRVVHRGPGRVRRGGRSRRPDTRPSAGSSAPRWQPVSCT